jgi:hypothetical protein
MNTFFAESMTTQNVFLAAIFAFIGALLYSLWQRGLRAWVVSKIDVLQDRIDEKIKPYVGDNNVEIRKTMDEIESVLLGMVDIILARKFTSKAIDNIKPINKQVLVKVLTKVMVSEEIAKDEVGLKLYNELKVILDALPDYVDPKTAISLLTKIETHEKEEKEVDVLAEIDEAKKIINYNNIF